MACGFSRPSTELGTALSLRRRAGRMRAARHYRGEMRFWRANADLDSTQRTPAVLRGSPAASSGSANVRKTVSNSLSFVLALFL